MDCWPQLITSDEISNKSLSNRTRERCGVSVSIVYPVCSTECLHQPTERNQISYQPITISLANLVSRNDRQTGHQQPNATEHRHSTRAFRVYEFLSFKKSFYNFVVQFWLAEEVSRKEFKTVCFQRQLRENLLNRKCLLTNEQSEFPLLNIAVQNAKINELETGFSRSSSARTAAIPRPVP